MSVEDWGKDNDRGKLKYWETNGHCATSFTADLTWTGLDLNISSTAKNIKKFYRN
jgi:hypothetical protein